MAADDALIADLEKLLPGSLDGDAAVESIIVDYVTAILGGTSASAVRKKVFGLLDDDDLTRLRTDLGWVMNDLDDELDSPDRSC